LRWKEYKAFDEAEVLDCLPSSLKTEVCLFSARNLVKSLPFLHNAEVGLILMMVNMLKPQTFIKKELIIREGEVAKEMYFLNEGTVQVESNGTIITLLRRGSYFGEIGLLRESKRVASVRARSNVDAYALTKEDFVMLMTHYPDSAVAMGKIAEHRKYNLDKAKSRKGSMPGQKNKSFLESVEELEKISLQTKAYKRSRTVSRMKDFLNRRNSLYSNLPDDNIEPILKNLSAEDTDDASSVDSKGQRSERDGSIEPIAEGKEEEFTKPDEDEIAKMKTELAKRELALQEKEVDLINREEKMEDREKNLSMLDELEGFTSDNINLEDNEEPAKVPPPI
jgi:CRP-like cAMP-binding protein